MDTLRKKLLAIQGELNVPKTHENKFGGYKYRNAEDILEAVKPLLTKNDCALVVFDEIVLIGERYYVKATAQLFDESGKIDTVAYAREPITKKGMDEAQITGATSSYARKYALNGLFAIDDTKDADSADNTSEGTKTPLAPKKATQEQIDTLDDLIVRLSVDEPKLLATYKVTATKDLNTEQAKQAIEILKKRDK